MKQWREIIGIRESARIEAKTVVNSVLKLLRNVA